MVRFEVGKGGARKGPLADHFAAHPNQIGIRDAADQFGEIKIRIKERTINPGICERCFEHAECERGPLQCSVRQIDEADVGHRFDFVVELRLGLAEPVIINKTAGKIFSRWQLRQRAGNC